jgi:hypothetical protein
MVVKLGSRASQFRRSGSPFRPKALSRPSSIPNQFLRMISSPTLQQPLSPDSRILNAAHRPIGVGISKLPKPQLTFNNNIGTLKAGSHALLQRLEAVPEPDQESELINPNPNCGHKLYLTPYIESGEILEAQGLARVQHLVDKVESYSAYLTVNREAGSNLFFWFFPASVSQSLI